RRPGRVIAPLPEAARVTALAVSQRAETAEVDVAFLSRALLHAISATPALGSAGRVPDIVAVKLAPDEVEVHLSVRASAPPVTPWEESEDGTTWRLDRRAEFELHESVAGYWQAPPFPALVTVGHTPAGAVWLVDVESAGPLSIDGDTDRTVDLLRHMAVELLSNTWSGDTAVYTVGFGSEMAGAALGRLVA